MGLDWLQVACIAGAFLAGYALARLGDRSKEGR